MYKIVCRSLAALLIALLFSSAALALQNATKDEAKQKSSSMPMGFDVDKAVHHFYLLKNGGAIELTAKDANDAAMIKTLKQHLEMQAKNFEKGNFETQMQVHGKLPDGAPMLKKLRNEITYDVKSLDNGATLRIFSVNPEARQAIHEFLKFQINEHQTGDPLTVE